MKLVLDYIDKSLINGWICDDCKYYVDILSRFCWSCGSYRDKGFNYAFSAYIISENRKGETSYYMNDEKRKELHAKFYNGTRVEVAVMNDLELAAFIEEMEEVCAKAKPTLRAAVDEQQERYAKLSKEERDNLLSQNARLISGSDTLNDVKIRKDKMSKADKTVQQFRDLGLDDATIEALSRNLYARNAGKEEVLKNKNSEPTELEKSIAAEKIRIAEIEKQEKIEAITKKAEKELDIKLPDFTDLFG